MSDSNIVDIWLIDLACQRHAIAKHTLILCQTERERAARFCFERDQRRFIVARSALRQILGLYTGLPPGDIAFSYGPNGKPDLYGYPKEGRVRFSLSHSSELALLAVSRAQSVGIDIELIRPDLIIDGLAEHFFSAREVSALRALPLSDRSHAFFSCWTRKEAYIKAFGWGLAVPLDSFTVAFGPGDPPSILSAADPTEASRWSMYDLNISSEYKAALVVEGRNHRLRVRDWDENAGHASTLPS